MSKHVTASYFLFSDTIAAMTDSELKRRLRFLLEGGGPPDRDMVAQEIRFIRHEVDIRPRLRRLGLTKADLFSRRDIRIEDDRLDAFRYAMSARQLTTAVAKLGDTRYGWDFGKPQSVAIKVRLS